jgi:hypothetical protein
MSSLSSCSSRPLSLSLILAASLAGACAEERPPINRVQPNALAKNFFVGAVGNPEDDPEFFYRPTVVDVDYGAGQSSLFTASYAQTLVRIRWEVSEDLLLARLSYDRIDGTSGEPEEGSVGQIVAAFAIDSHFDIKRGYNPQTGEELNVVEENTDDRPWYQREYMRVDWSQNLITTAYELDTVAGLKAFADHPLTYEPVAYYVEDPNHADRPWFSPEEGYFDITNKVYATPNTVPTPWGEVPACFFSPDVYGGSYPEENCNPVEVKLRLSFRKVVDTDYEPVHWDGQRQNMFGMFTTASRLGYDRSYGIVDQKWYRFASRHNIWERSHAEGADGHLVPCNTPETTGTDGDPRRDVDPLDGTEDECAAAGPGSRCDVFKQACTLPYRSRETRTIPIYYGPNGDPGLWETSRDVTAEWDGALRQAAQVARYGECIAVSGGVDPGVIESCKAEFPPTLEAALDSVPEILVFCHNPVESGDHPACGAPGLEARIGDLRYNMVNIIQDPQTDSPWGILADAIDPLSGEVVSASVNVWNARTDLAVQNSIDMMRWYNGELSNTDVTDARYLGALVTENARRTAAWTSPPVLSAEEVKSRVGSSDRSLIAGEKVSLPKLPASDLVEWALSRARQRYGAPSGGGPTAIQARILRAKEQGVESSLLTRQYYDLGRVETSAPLSRDVLDRVSPLRSNLFGFKTALDRQRQLLLAERGRCMLEGPEPSSVVELGRIMDEKFPLDEDPETPGIQATAESVYQRNESWRDYLRRRFTHGVLAHEMGHSMGLRHVFTSSFDAINYRPQYWQLRTRDGAETEYCTEPTEDGTECVGPRWRDPVTESEQKGLLYRWQQTSVMEYPGDLSQETLDIGPYDRAALRFAYGDMVDMWDSEEARCNATGSSCTTAGGLLVDQLDGFGGITGPWYQGSTGIVHYSRLQNELGLIRGCREASLDPPADYDADRDGNYSPELDGNVVNGTVCDGVPLDHVPFRELTTTIDPNNGPTSRVDALGRVRHPYLFASDEWADIGNLAVRRSDNGADAYEVTNFLISEYEDRHVWDNYRRSRTSFSLTRAVNRSYGRYLEQLKEIYKGYAFLNDLFAASGAVDDLLGGPDADGSLMPSVLAASQSFDQLARILTRPTVGPHVVARDDVSDRDVLRFFEANTTQTVVDVDVPNGTVGAGSNVWFGGRPLENSFDNNQGYYSVDYQLGAGSYYDKTQVIELLTDSSSRFVDASRDDFYDWRYRQSSLASLYPEGVRRLIANALTEDADVLGWRVAGDDGSEPRPIVGDDSRPSAPMGARVWWPSEGAPVCWPSSNSSVCVAYPNGDVGSNVDAPASSFALDPEIGFEVQKFIVFWGLTYLPENWKLDWVDMMRIWIVGSDVDPAFPDSERIAWRDPVSGQLYVAHRYGREEIDGRAVERGIAARVLSWMNLLTQQAYEISAENAGTGELTVERYVDDSNCPAGKSTCAGQPIEKSPEYTLRTKNYKSVLDFMRQVTATYGFYDPAWRGLYQ